jgi:hypothetical protein
MRTRNDPSPAAKPQPDLLAAVLRSQLTELNLPFIREHCHSVAQTAADKHWSHLDYLTELVASEAAARADRRVQRRIKDARFPVLKTLDQFDWNWPTKINRLQVQNLFHLDFVAQHANVVFISGTGLGKSHLMTHQELKRPGVTLQLLWEEYQQQHAGQAYKYSAFCEKYRAWARRLQRSMRQTHTGGERCSSTTPARPCPSSTPTRRDHARPRSSWPCWAHRTTPTPAPPPARPPPTGWPIIGAGVHRRRAPPAGA